MTNLIDPVSSWGSNVGGPALQLKLVDPVNEQLSLPAAPPLAKLRNSGAQSIPDSTSTALTWDSEVFDTVNGHDTTTNKSRYTVQAACDGIYQCRATVAWSANATGNRRVWFNVNGAGVDATENRLAGSSIQTSLTSATLLQLAAGDYVEVMVSQTSGGALALASGSGTFQSWFEVQWIHP